MYRYSPILAICTPFIDNIPLIVFNHIEACCILSVISPGAFAVFSIGPIALRYGKAEGPIQIVYYPLQISSKLSKYNDRYCEVDREKGAYTNTGKLTK
jgi:hypothetical protein